MGGVRMEIQQLRMDKETGGSIFPVAVGSMFILKHVVFRLSSLKYGPLIPLPIPAVIENGLDNDLIILLCATPHTR